MSQSGYTPIQLYRSATPAAAPSAGNLSDGELAINTDDGKLYYKDSGGVVQVMASKAAAAGSFVTLSASGHVTFEGVTSTGATGTGNLVFSASPTFTGTLSAAAITASGTITKNNTAATLSNFLTATGSTTGASYLSTSNTSGNLLLGVENSVGGGSSAFFASGSSAYDTALAYASGKGFSVGPFSGAVGWRMDGTGYISSPSTYSNTSASAANMYIDSGGYFYRSTSSLQYKTALQDLTLEEARAISLGRHAFSYSSTARADNPNARFIGYGAEEIFKIDSRFVSLDGVGAPNGVSYERFVVPHGVILDDHDARLDAIETKLGMNQNVGM